MSLASTLLEEYNHNANSASVVIGDPLMYIQEACTEFVTECYSAYHTFKTADIIGSAQVVVESSDATAIYESVVGDYIKKLTETFAKFIAKFKEWAKSIQNSVNTKIRSTIDNSIIKKVSKIINGYDDDEKILKFTYPSPEYNVEDGVKTTETYVDALADLYFKVTEAMFSTLSGEVETDQHETVAKKFTMDNIKKMIKSSLKCDPDDIPNNIVKSFGGGVSNEMTYTVGNIREKIASVPSNKEILLNQVNEVKALDKILDEMNHKLSTITTDDTGMVISPDVLNTFSSAISYLVNLQISALTATIDNIVYALKQDMAILSALCSAKSIVTIGGNSVTEGVDPELDDDMSDPPSEDEPVEEGVNINMIKKYIDKCRPAIKRMTNAEKAFNKAKTSDEFETVKKQYVDICKTFEEVSDELADIPDSTASDLFSMASTPISEFIIAFDSLKQNFWINKTMRTNHDSNKAAEQTNNSRNMTKTGFIAKINACVNRCKRQIKACDSKIDKPSETSSLFEQAMKYI